MTLPRRADHPILVVRQIRELAELIDCEVNLVPRHRLTDCQRDCLRVVEDAGGPITTARILETLEARGWLWGERTVKGALADLARLGLLVSSRRAPQGYRMP